MIDFDYLHQCRGDAPVHFNLQHRKINSSNFYKIVTVGKVSMQFGQLGPNNILIPVHFQDQLTKEDVGVIA